MSEIIKTYRQSVPALRFIGKKYGDGDRVNGNFGAKWGEWFEKGWFTEIEKLHGKDEEVPFEDGGAYIGLMRCKNGEPFEYWIGIFMAEGVEAPDGFDFVDFPASNLGVCWIRGFENEVYFKEDECWKKLGENGYKVINDKNDACWFFERYGCPRFTKPDENGMIILDICFYIE